MNLVGNNLLRRSISGALICRGAMFGLIFCPSSLPLSLPIPKIPFSNVSSHKPHKPLAPIPQISFRGCRTYTKSRFIITRASKVGSKGIRARTRFKTARQGSYDTMMIKCVYTATPKTTADMNHSFFFVHQRTAYIFLYCISIVSSLYLRVSLSVKTSLFCLHSDWATRIVEKYSSTSFQACSFTPWTRKPTCESGRITVIPPNPLVAAKPYF